MQLGNKNIEESHVTRLMHLQLSMASNIFSHGNSNENTHILGKA